MQHTHIILHSFVKANVLDQSIKIIFFFKKKAVYTCNEGFEFIVYYFNF